MPDHKLPTSHNGWQMVLRVALEVAALYVLYLMLAEVAKGIGFVATVLCTLGAALIALLIMAAYVLKWKGRKRRASVHRRRQNA